MGGFGSIDIESGEVALAGGGDIETETELGGAIGGTQGTRPSEEGWELLVEEQLDFFFAVIGRTGIKLAEEAEDVLGFEVDAVDGVIGAAAFDGGPLDDGVGLGAEWVAHVGLLEGFVGAGASAAIVEELFDGEMGALPARHRYAARLCPLAGRKVREQLCCQSEPWGMACCQGFGIDA